MSFVFTTKHVHPSLGIHLSVSKHHNVLVHLIRKLICSKNVPRIKEIENIRNIW